MLLKLRLPFLLLLVLVLFVTCTSEKRITIDPVYWASATGDLDSVQIALRQGFNVNGREPGTGITLLHYATGVMLQSSEARYGQVNKDGKLFAENIEMVKLLVSYGADVNAQFGSDGRTPLGIATYHGRFRTVELLIRAGADPNIKSGLSAPLEIAAFHCFHESAKAILSSSRPMLPDMLRAALSNARRNKCVAVEKLICDEGSLALC